jgi:hypothetical protein
VTALRKCRRDRKVRGDPPMRFQINRALVKRAQEALSPHKRLFWVIGGAGSGKTTICRVLSASYTMPVYDMDAHIYGTYHSRFTRERHPVNWERSTSGNGLAWLLALTWDSFECFNRAALPEYLDLLAEDIGPGDADSGLIVDGGISSPALLAQMVPVGQVVCLARPECAGASIWEGGGERRGMKEAILRLAEPEQAWRQFLALDEKTTGAILKECQESGIAVCRRADGTTPGQFAEHVASTSGLRRPGPGA